MTNELMDVSENKGNPKRRTVLKNGWTPERRARQRAAISRWKPWTQSSGPASGTGKARAAKNALKHGYRGRDWLEFLDVLARQRAYVRRVVALRRLRESRPSLWAADTAHEELAVAIKVIGDPVIDKHRIGGRGIEHRRGPVVISGAAVHAEGAAQRIKRTDFAIIWHIPVIIPTPTEPLAIGKRRLPVEFSGGIDGHGIHALPAVGRNTYINGPIRANAAHGRARTIAARAGLARLDAAAAGVINRARSVGRRARIRVGTVPFVRNQIAAPAQLQPVDGGGQTIGAILHGDGARLVLLGGHPRNIRPRPLHKRKSQHAEQRHQHEQHNDCAAALRLPARRRKMA